MTDQWEHVQRGRELLLGGYQVQWTPSRMTSSGARTMPYPAYDDVLMKALWAAQSIVGTDYEYLASYKRVREVPLGSVSGPELSTWFTYILRGERFSDGHIAQYVESGELLVLLERLIALRDSLPTATGGAAGEE
ncbi:MULTISPECIES: DUF6508 domain-containing protein [Microbacterium]|uniref:DUF6508 domain-containing protein n=1 Tax=Microbacterium TaxID=33882 RepID=UPI001E295F2D|nr:DUF6508 domain-containing protein [Microbacterium nymphoidis]MCD2497709.1 DUF6508 domain-containing protein [Microbacterium nymphoidis]